MLTTTELKFNKICLFCGRPNNSINYTCDCKGEDWQHQYRSLDLEIRMDAGDREKCRTSFENYHFGSREGLLQYYPLPGSDFFTYDLDAVGLTTLHKLHELGKYMAVDLYLKDEGENPSGCFKDRETLLCLLNSRRKNLQKAVIYSSGNAAASAAIFAQKLQFHLITFVAGDTYTEKIDFIRSHGSDVVVIGDENTSFEEGFRLFAEVNAEGLFARYDFDNWSVRNPYRVQGDKTAAVEIVKQLSAGSEITVPDYIVVPTANGSCLAGLWKGFKEMKEAGIISRLPKMISAGIKGANPVFKAVQSGITDRPVKCDLSDLSPENAHIGSIIIAEEGYDSIEAAKAVLESGGLAVEVDAEDIQDSLLKLLSLEREKLTENSLLPEPASLISIAAIDQFREKAGVKPSDKIVSFITGHGVKASEMIYDLLGDREKEKKIVTDIITKKEKQLMEKVNKPGKCLRVPVEPEKLVQAFLDLKSTAYAP